MFGGISFHGLASETGYARLPILVTENDENTHEERAHSVGYCRSAQSE